MRAAMLRHLSLFTRNFLSPPTLKTKPNYTATSRIYFSSPSLFNFRFFTSNDDSSIENQNQPLSATNVEETKNRELVDIEDVSNKELKMQIDNYFKNGDEEVLPSIFDMILKRRAKGEHEDTDDELMDELREMPLVDDVKDKEFESDFEEAHETDEEIDNLYNARDIVMKKMVKDEYFNMDDKKWDEMVKEATEHGYLKDTKECEKILESMFMWENLLPDELKKKVQEKFNEIEDRIESGELEAEEGYNLYMDFEDKMLKESARLMEEEGPPQFDETAKDKKKDLDDPPGDGPILRWETRVVFAPGGDAWHPKNRKVKMAVTVKELGLSKHQFRRLRELVGKRYHPGKDELTITSERFEDREENRKDCLRTLFSLIEEAGKANKLVEDAQTSYFKNRLRTNGKFMETLRAKMLRREGSTLLHG